MLELKVRSDASTPELQVAARFIDDLIKLRTGDAMASDGAISKPTLSEFLKEFPLPTDKIRGTSIDKVIYDEIFNATELAEAEQLGKSVASTVVVDQSTTAHVDTQVNTSLPDPTTVFGQAVQTTANVVNPVAPTTDNPALDANGFPWDARIHSSSRERVKDGTWRKRRGVDDAVLTQVEAELRGVMSVPVPPVSHGSPIPQVIAEIDGMPTIPCETANLVTPTNAIHIVGETMTFAELLDGVTQAMVGGTVTQVAIGTALQSLGLSALPQLVARPDLIPAFREALGGIV